MLFCPTCGNMLLLERSSGKNRLPFSLENRFSHFLSQMLHKKGTLPNLESCIVGFVPLAVMSAELVSQSLPKLLCIENLSMMFWVVKMPGRMLNALKQVARWGLTEKRAFYSFIFYIFYKFRVINAATKVLTFSNCKLDRLTSL